MRKYLVTGVIAASVLPAIGAGVARGEAKDPLALVPDKAIVVVRINNLDKGLKGVRDLIGIFDEGAGAQAADALRGLIGQALKNPELAGVNTAGSHMVMFFNAPGAGKGMGMMPGMMGPGAGAPPKPKKREADDYTAVVVAVSDFDQFRSALVGEGTKVTKGPGGWEVLGVQRRQIDFDAMENAQQAGEGGGKVIYKSVSQNAYLLHRGSYAVYTTSGTALRLMTASKASLAERIAAEDAKVLRQSDLAVYVNLELIIKTYRTILMQVQGMAAMVTGMMGAMGGGGPGMEGAPGGMGGMKPEQMAAVGRMLPGIINGVFQFIYDCRGLSAGATFLPDALRCTMRLSLKEGSQSTSGFARHKPGPVKSMGLLPKGSGFYMGVELDIKAFVEWFRDLMQQGVADAMGLDEEGTAKMTEMLDNLIACDPREIAWTMTMGEKGGLREVALMRVANAGKLKAALNEQMFKAMAGATPGVKVTYTPKAETYKGVRIDKTEMAFDMAEMTKAGGGPAGAAQAAMANQVMKMVLGGEKMTTRGAIVGSWYVTAVGDDPSLVRAGIDAVKAGKGQLATDPAYLSARKMLPAKTNVIVFLSLPRAAHGLLSLLTKMPMLGEMIPIAPKPKPTFDESLTALSMTFGANSIRFDTHIPHKQLSGIKDVFVGAADLAEEDE